MRGSCYVGQQLVVEHPTTCMGGACHLTALWAAVYCSLLLFLT
jgi:hypothetical protein